MPKQPVAVETPPLALEEAPRMIAGQLQAPLDAPIDALGAEPPPVAAAGYLAMRAPVASVSGAGGLPLVGPVEPPALKKAAGPRPEEVILHANQAARMEPTADGYRIGTHLFPYIDGALYQLYAQPLRFSHIRLQPGEALSGDAVIGDPHRWKLVESVVGTGEQATTILLVMPLLDDLATTLTILTDRHLYVFECVASKKAYMAQVGFLYPAEEAQRQAQQRRQQGPQAPPVSTPLSLVMGYTIAPADRKNPPPWTPVMAFSDTTRLYIEFPTALATTDLPALFVPVGKGLEVINYRAATGALGQTFLVVDGLPETVELRVVKDKQISTVQIFKAARL
jgi:type IV secretion system protein VirB9